MDLGGRGNSRRLGAGLAGVAARSRSNLVPHSRPPRSSAQTFSEEGHRTRFPRPGNAQGHEEGRQQKGSGVAFTALLGGSGCGQPGCLDQPTHALAFNPHGCLHLVARPCPFWNFPSQEALAHASHNAVTTTWTDLVRRVMLFITSHTQQAVNVSAAEPARGWRQWAKEACQGSAGAGHASTKTGIEDGEHCGLAGPELLVKQMETWLPLCMDGRRANAKQLTDQELLPRPSLEEVGDVCKTYKSTAGLGHRLHQPQGCSTAPCRSASALHRVAHAFEAKLVKAHT